MIKSKKKNEIVSFNYADIDIMYNNDLNLSYNIFQINFKQLPYEHKHKATITYKLWYHELFYFKSY